MIKFEEDTIDFRSYMRDTDLTQGFGTRDNEMALLSILINFPDKLEDCNNLSTECFFSGENRVLCFWNVPFNFLQKKCL